MLLPTLVSAQNAINSDNYYSFYKDHNFYKSSGVKKLSTGRLSEFDVAKVLYLEMKAAGFEWLNNFRIVHIDSDKYVISICFSEKSKFGFVFDGSFEMIPDKKVRELPKHSKNDQGFEYTEKIVDINGDTRFVNIVQLPENLYLIRSDIYWFQETENPEVNKTLVSKDIAIQILQHDVREILKSIHKN